MSARRGRERRRKTGECRRKVEKGGERKKQQIHFAEIPSTLESGLIKAMGEAEEEEEANSKPRLSWLLMLSAQTHLTNTQELIVPRGPSDSCRLN